MKLKLKMFFVLAVWFVSTIYFTLLNSHGTSLKSGRESTAAAKRSYAAALYQQLFNWNLQTNNEIESKDNHKNVFKFQQQEVNQNGEEEVDDNTITEADFTDDDSNEIDLKLGVENNVVDNNQNVANVDNRVSASKDEHLFASCEESKDVLVKTDINTFLLSHQLDTSSKALYKQSLIYHQEQDTKEDKTLHIIILPHTHSDPGWLKTVQGYFDYSTTKTFDLIVEKLVKYPNMTFIWPETVFLQMWWDRARTEQKINFKKVLMTGQLEIVTGGWVQPDEATTHYFSLIDQMIEGHQWLHRHLGVKPKHAWSTDNFGYSPSMAYLYQKAGYKTLGILRVHDDLKKYMSKHQLLEFHWRQVWDEEGRHDLFTEVLPYNLMSIRDQCGPDKYTCETFNFATVKISGRTSKFPGAAKEVTEQNVHEIASKFLEQCRKKNSLYRHNVVLDAIGCDFTYTGDDEWENQYRNYQKLISYMNSKWNVKARFGTLNDFYEELDKQLNEDRSITIPSLQGDFYPYKSPDYWTGFFSTRPYDKNLERELAHYLRTAEIFHVLAAATKGKFKAYSYYKTGLEDITVARQALALFQHHDAITGTSRAFVVKDYEQKLFDGLKAATKVLEHAIIHLLDQSDRDGENAMWELDGSQPRSFGLIEPLTKTIELNDDDEEKKIILCNPHTQYREDIITLIVNQENVQILDEKGNKIRTQLNPVFLDEKSGTTFFPLRFQVVFFAKLAPLSLTQYTVKYIEEKPKENEITKVFYHNQDQTKPMHVPISKRIQKAENFAGENTKIELENQYLKLEFNSSSGYLKSVLLKQSGKKVEINTSLLTYTSSKGAYIFQPMGGDASDRNDISLSKIPTVIIFRGPVVSEIHILRVNIRHVVKIFHTDSLIASAIELDNIVDMTPMMGRDLILRFNTNIIPSAKNKYFYTDLNGLHSMKRKTFSAQPTPANYYPMTSFAYIENEASVRMSILSAQSLGVSSQFDGSLEVMLDRRLRFDDGKGLSEGVTDSKLTPTRFLLFFESINSRSKKIQSYEETQPASEGNLLSFPSLQSQQLLKLLQQYSIVFHVKDNLKASQASYKALQTVFPCDVELVNLRGLLQDSEITSDTFSAAMLLHKIGYACTDLGENANVTPLCAHSKQDIVPSQIFHNVDIQDMLNSSLSLMYEFQRVDLNRELNLKKMEVQSYKVTFKK